MMEIDRHCDVVDVADETCISVKAPFFIDDGVEPESSFFSNPIQMSSLSLTPYQLFLLLLLPLLLLLRSPVSNPHRLLTNQLRGIRSYFNNNSSSSSNSNNNNNNNINNRNRNNYRNNKSAINNPNVLLISVHQSNNDENGAVMKLIPQSCNIDSFNNFMGNRGSPDVNQPCNASVDQSDGENAT